MNCIVKHLGFAEGEAEEAISHSLVVEGVQRSKSYGTLRDEIYKLRKKIQSGDITQEEGIHDIRKVRALFEQLNPSYDISKCASCGPTEIPLKKLTELATKTAPNPSNPTKEKKKLNTKNSYTHVIGERKMAYNVKAIASDALVGFVAGTGGAALHFLGFAPRLDAYTVMGVKGGAIADIVAGLISVVVGTQVRQDWLKSILALLGATLMGLGVAHAAGWTVAAAPVARVLAPAAVLAPSPVMAAYPRGLPGAVVNKHGTVPEITGGTYA